VPVVEGGGECGIENIRTLCLGCHTSVTRELRGRLKQVAPDPDLSNCGTEPNSTKPDGRRRKPIERNDFESIKGNPYGQDFELCAIGDGHLHIYWLLPITEREHDYKVENGADALEEVVETKRLEYWKTKRKSVI
jgi:hypothetical protein